MSDGDGETEMEHHLQLQLQPWAGGCGVDHVVGGGAVVVAGANKTRGAAIKNQLNTEIAACDKKQKAQEHKHAHDERWRCPACLLRRCKHCGRACAMCHVPCAM
jgi:hypothetical protein